MLVSDLVNAKSIALASTENASNQIPYLGLQWWPETKIAGLDLSWIKTHKGLAVSLAPSNFDALPKLRARKGLAKEKTQMAFFREQMTIDEAEAIEFDRIQSSDDPYLKTALMAVYDDTNELVSGAEVVPERMRMQLLATVDGHPCIGIESDGVEYMYDYDPNGTYASTHYKKLTGTLTWDKPSTAKPLTDLNNARKYLATQGKIARYALMNTNTFNYLLDSAQVQNAILAQNLTANIELTDEVVKSIVKARTQLTIIIYDKMFSGENGDEQFYPDNKVTLLPEGPLGKTFFGTTPEERTARQVADVDVAMYGVGIAVATKTEYGPPAITSVTASEVVLPSYENMDATYVLEVAVENP